jgi:hypothetical protein
MFTTALKPLRTALALVLAGGALGLAGTSPAAADARSFADGTTTPGTMDIHRVRVINERRVTIRVVVQDLRRRAGQGSAGAWLDTDQARSGPEFYIGSGLYDSDWMIGRARDWRVVGSGPLACPIDQRLLFERDTIVWTTGAACLGRYGKVRVSVTTQGAWGTDHSPARRAFHAWVRRY